MAYTENRINELNKQLEIENKRYKKINITHGISVVAFLGATACSLAFSAILPAILIASSGLIVSKFFFNSTSEIKSDIKKINNSIAFLAKKQKRRIISPLLNMFFIYQPKEE